MQDRTKSLAADLAKRADKEVADLTAVLQELARSIRTELAAPPPQQLELWTPPEREQLSANRAALEARLAAVPAEIERETNAIRARYADPGPRLFPLAVMFLVPEKMG
jgi:hypothetical protein